MKTKVMVIIGVVQIAISGLKAQTFQANFEYDANGNREKTTVICLTCQPTVVEDEEWEESKTITTVRIYPNPTKGELIVELKGVNLDQLTNQKNAIKLWDIEGILIFKISPIRSTNVVNLSGYNRGTFILQLFINGKAKDYKIVKK